MENERNTKQLIKTSNGITLIALVITIIVLLILAGVTIATLTGDNGILGKAKTAKTTNNEEKAKEQIKIAIMGSYGKDGELNYDDLTKNLEQIGIKDLPNEASYPLEVTLEGVIAEIDENGEVNFTTSGGYTQTGDTITSPDGKTMKVGDYVDYDPTLEANASDLTYTSTADKTGTNSDQEFNATTYKIICINKPALANINSLYGLVLISFSTRVNPPKGYNVTLFILYPNNKQTKTCPTS